LDKEEARAVLAEELRKYRNQSYRSLQRLLSDVDAYCVAGPSGTEYQIEVQAVWDGHPHENLRVMASIDDGGWRAFVPMSDGFILSASGEFVGE
jgi:hypothetical protein